MKTALRPARNVLSLALPMLILGCAGPVARVFESFSYSYPSHMERGTPDVIESKSLNELEVCKSTPELESFFRTWVPRIDQSLLDRIAHRQWPNAEACAYVAPFVVTDGKGDDSQTETVQFIAIRVECYFDDGSINGVPPPHARTILRSVDEERALDGWPPIMTVRDAVALWNIMLLRPLEDGLVFHDFVFHFDEERYSRAFTDNADVEQSRWWDCGSEVMERPRKYWMTR